MKRKEHFPKFLTCLCGRVVSKGHLPTLILTCLWTSANKSPEYAFRDFTIDFVYINKNKEQIMDKSSNFLYQFLKRNIEASYVPKVGPRSFFLSRSKSGLQC